MGKTFRGRKEGWGINSACKPSGSPSGGNNVDSCELFCKRCVTIEFLQELFDVGRNRIDPSLCVRVA